MRMTTRRRKSKSVDLFTALLLELGTMAAIIAIAQPSRPHSAAEPAEPTASAVQAANQLPVNQLPLMQLPVMQPIQFDRTTVDSARLASPDWNPGSLRLARVGSVENLSVPGTQPAPAHPVLPPPIPYQPAWIASY